MNDILDKLEPVFNGMPVIVRLTTGEDILCILYQSQDISDGRMVMERPLRVISEEVPPSSSDNRSTSYTKGLYTRIRARFDRWMVLTDVPLFPVFSEHVISIAPLSDHYVNTYIEWADQLYAPLVDARTSPQDSTFPPTIPTSNTEVVVSDEAKRAYLDFILQNFTPKGKPN